MRPAPGPLVKLLPPRSAAEAGAPAFPQNHAYGAPVWLWDTYGPLASLRPRTR